MAPQVQLYYIETPSLELDVEIFPKLYFSMPYYIPHLFFICLNLAMSFGRVKYNNARYRWRRKIVEVKKVNFAMVEVFIV